MEQKEKESKQSMDNYLYGRKINPNIQVSAFTFDDLKAPPLLSIMPERAIIRLYNEMCTGKRVKKKIEYIDAFMHYYGFRRMTIGKNRAVYISDYYPNIVLKVAFDRNAMMDSKYEFRYQFLFEPFVTKVFEVDPTGVIGMFERVIPIKDRLEFAKVSDLIFNLIYFIFTRDKAMWDIGTRSFKNWGIRPGFGPVLLDYPYVYNVDDRKLICNNELPDGSRCKGRIKYDVGYNYISCSHCGRRVSPSELQVDDKIYIRNKRYLKYNPPINSGYVEGEFDKMFENFKINIVRVHEDGTEEVIREQKKQTTFINRKYTSNDNTDKRNIEEVPEENIISRAKTDKFDISIVRIPVKEVKQATKNRSINNVSKTDKSKTPIGKINRAVDYRNNFKAEIVSSDGNILSTTNTKVKLSDIAIGNSEEVIDSNSIEENVSKMIKEEKKEIEYTQPVTTHMNDYGKIKIEPKENDDSIEIVDRTVSTIKEEEIIEEVIEPVIEELVEESTEEIINEAASEEEVVEGEAKEIEETFRRDNEEVEESNDDSDSESEQDIQSEEVQESTEDESLEDDEEVEESEEDLEEDDEIEVKDVSEDEEESDNDTIYICDLYSELGYDSKEEFIDIIDDIGIDPYGQISNDNNVIDSVINELKDLLNIEDDDQSEESDSEEPDYDVEDEEEIIGLLNEGNNSHVANPTRGNPFAINNSDFYNEDDDDDYIGVEKIKRSKERLR